MQLRQARPWLQPDILFKLSGYQKEHDACLKLLHDFSNETIRNRRLDYMEIKKNKDQNTAEDEAIGNWWNCCVNKWLGLSVNRHALI